MNIAFQALVVTLAVLPGIVFFGFFRAPILGRQGFSIGDGATLFISGLVFALPINWIWLQILAPYVGSDIRDALELAAKVPSDLPVPPLPNAALKPNILETVSNSFGYIVIYFFSSTIFAAFYGLTVRFFFIFMRIDSKFFPNKIETCRLSLVDLESLFVSFVSKQADKFYYYEGIISAKDLIRNGISSGLWLTDLSRVELKPKPTDAEPKLSNWILRMLTPKAKDTNPLPEVDNNGSEIDLALDLSNIDVFHIDTKDIPIIGFEKFAFRRQVLFFQTLKNIFVYLSACTFLLAPLAMASSQTFNLWIKDELDFVLGMNHKYPFIIASLLVILGPIFLRVFNSESKK